MPIVRVSQAMKALPAGDRLLVEATDPAFPADIEAWVKMLGHRLIELENGPLKKALIEKS